MLIATALGVVAGAFAGWGARLLLGRLRRGVTMPPPLLELATAIVTGVGIVVGWPSPTLGLVVWAGWLAVTLSAVDIVAHRLPDALTLPAMPVSAGLVLVTWLAAPQSGRPLTGLVAAVVIGGIFWAVAVLAPRAMGRGDVKLVPSLALMTGYGSVSAALWWLIIAFGLGAAVALAGLAARRLSLGSAIAFGPCLLAACWFVLAFPGLTTL